MYISLPYIQHVFLFEFGVIFPCHVRYHQIELKQHQIIQLTISILLMQHLQQQQLVTGSDLSTYREAPLFEYQTGFEIKTKDVLEFKERECYMFPNQRLKYL